MPYITIKQPPKYYQMTFEDILAGIEDLGKYVTQNIANTRTYWVERVNNKLLENTDIIGMIELLKIYNQSKEALFNADRSSLYHTFHIITNIMMIAIDHKISNKLHNFDNKRFVYTRYADDLLISCKLDFDKNKIEQFIGDILTEFNAPFSLKKEKTRYGSSSGRNWNLGIMLNKDIKSQSGINAKKNLRQCLTIICETENPETTGNYMTFRFWEG